MINYPGFCIISMTFEPFPVIFKAVFSDVIVYNMTSRKYQPA